jgi:uncharacterized membrane protein
VQPGEWQAIVDAMDAHFHAGRFEEGALAGVRGVAQLLERHFPGTGEGRNQIPDRPIMM